MKNKTKQNSEEKKLNIAEQIGIADSKEEAREKRLRCFPYLKSDEQELDDKLIKNIDKFCEVRK